MIKTLCLFSLFCTGDTRFATQYLMMKHLVEVKGALQETVVNRLWDGWANKQPYRQTAQDIKDMVMDGSTWRDMNLLVKVMEPIVTLLRLVDSKTPCMGKVYHGCFTVLEQVRTCSVPEDVKGVLEDLAMSRWAMLHSPLHAPLQQGTYWTLSTGTMRSPPMKR